MTGIRYLIGSSLLIAVATLVSANYQTFGENASFAQLFSLGALCENEAFMQAIPFRLDCGYYGSLDEPKPAINFRDDERVLR